MSKEAVWERFCTLSQIAVLEGEEREVSRSSIIIPCTSFLSLRILPLLAFSILSEECKSRTISRIRLERTGSLTFFCIIFYRKLARSIKTLSIRQTWRRMKRARSQYMAGLSQYGRPRSLPRAQGASSPRSWTPSRISCRNGESDVGVFRRS